MEERDVLIRVKGVQEYEGTDQDGTELVTEGKLARLDDGTLRLRYQESALTGLEGTETTFHVLPERVTLVRSGATNSQMIFELGRRHLSVYETPYGGISVEVRTRTLEQDLDETGGTLTVSYGIELDHQMAGESSFFITVQPKPGTAL